MLSVSLVAHSLIVAADAALVAQAASESHRARRQAEDPRSNFAYGRWAVSSFDRGPDGPLLSHRTTCVCVSESVALTLGVNGYQPLKEPTALPAVIRERHA